MLTPGLLKGRGDGVAACLAGQRIVSRHLADNTLLQNYTTILEIIMRLRMICDSADLVTQDAPQGTAQTPNQAAASHPELVVRLISVLKVRNITAENCWTAWDAELLTLNSATLWCRHCSFPAAIIL